LLGILVVTLLRILIVNLLRIFVAIVGRAGTPPVVEARLGTLAVAVIAVMMAAAGVGARGHAHHRHRCKQHRCLQHGSRPPLILAHYNARNAVWFATHFATHSALSYGWRFLTGGGRQMGEVLAVQ